MTISPRTMPPPKPFVWTKTADVILEKNERARAVLDVVAVREPVSITVAFSFKMRLPGGGLMRPSPDGPGDDARWPIFYETRHEKGASAPISLRSWRRHSMQTLAMSL